MRVALRCCDEGPFTLCVLYPGVLSIHHFRCRFTVTVYGLKPRK